VDEVDCFLFFVQLPFDGQTDADICLQTLKAELIFPEAVCPDKDAESLIRGLLEREPSLRFCASEIKNHPFFGGIDWDDVYYKRRVVPSSPSIQPEDEGFDDTLQRTWTSNEGDTSLNLVMTS